MPTGSRASALLAEDKVVEPARSSPVLHSGDEAVALAALDAGICFASSYPGTPATDILEAVIKHADPALVRCVWSVNEKVAYESALAVGICGQRAIVAMKQVGLNVAADAFLNSCPAGTNGGLVLVVGDDPECHSSQNKQDTRHYRAISGVLLLEPSDSQEAYSMTREAFRASERFKLPVIIRLTTRTAYGCTPVRREPAEARSTAVLWPKEPQRFFIVPNVSRRLFRRIFELQSEMESYLAATRFHSRADARPNAPRPLMGVVCAGVGFALAQELAPEEAGILKVPGEPFSDNDLKGFIDAHDEVYVLEEGDPYLERRVRALATEVTRIRGRMSGDLKPVGELQPAEVEAMFGGVRYVAPDSVDLPPRLPEICKPCGYNKVFGALKGISDIATPSDIGCNTLGGLPPYSVMDGVWAMGSSIGIACGLAATGHKRVLAIIGDSTFYHAGLPPTIEAVHEGYCITVLLLDNGTAAMTGGQGVAHRGSDPARRIDLVTLIHALGVQSCTPFDPHRLGVTGIRDLVEDSFQQPGVKVLLYRSQCGIYSPGYFTESNPNKVALEKEE